MDNPVHDRRAAIYTMPASKRLSPSFFWALGVALAVHAGFFYYLAHQDLAASLVTGPTMIEDKPTVITMERLKPVVEKSKPADTVRVHDPVTTTITDTDPLPLTPNPDHTLTTSGETKIISDPGPVTTVVSDPNPGPVYAKASWARFPDASALIDYYPQRAANDEVEGKVTVQCTVLDTSGRVACVTISEIPGGYGFGAATVRMVQDKGRVDTTKGDVQVGSILRQTVVWQLS